MVDDARPPVGDHDVNKRTLGFALLGLILSIVVIQLPFAIAERSMDYRWSNPIIDVWYLVNRSFVEKPDDLEMRDAAIRGMLDALGDPYTEFVPNREVEDFDKVLRGTFVGIGASVRIEDGWPTIVTPLDDSPALQAGIMAGDRIIAIGGESTRDLTLDEAIEMLAGEPGTSVTVRVLRDLGDELDITIERERIFTPTIKGYYRVDGDWRYFLDTDRNIAYLRISQFTQESAMRLAEALESLGDDVGGVVLDLRFNRGGLLQAAIHIADMFLPEGHVIVSSEGRMHARQEYVSSNEVMLVSPDVPVVVLVNAGSASASEVLAGALADNDRAIVVGERTYGKGTVQSVLPLESGAGQLKITQAYYYLPSGRKVHRTDNSTEWGVDPTEGFYVSMTRREITEMRRQAYEADIIRENGDEQETEDIGEHAHEPAWIRSTMRDPQLAAALEALQIRVDEGDWRPTGRTVDHAGLDLVELQALQTQRDRILRELTRLDRRAQALIESASGSDETFAERDLIPDDVTLTGGALVIRDADGAVVAELEIVGEDLERWLIDADVEPATPAPDEGS
jgi:carboxyl-terminal processing protease